MSWVTDNLAQSLVVLGLALLAVEILILGFATFVLLFVGLAAVLTGAIMYLGWVEQSLLNAMLMMASFTLVAAALLWKPLKTMQTKVDDSPAKSDLIGYTFTLQEDIAPGSQTKHRYSGVDWLLKSEQRLSAGTQVEVVAVDVGIFEVKQAL